MIRLKHQRHPLAFHLRIPLDLTDRPQLGLYLVHDLAPKVYVCQLATPELERELHLVPLFEELAGVVDLDQKIVVPDLHRAQLQLLELARPAGSAGAVFLLLLLIAPLPVVHDLADWGARVGSDFDEIESCLPGPAKCIGGRDRADLVVVLIDEEDRRNADLLVVAEIGRNGALPPKDLSAPSAHADDQANGFSMPVKTKPQMIEDAHECESVHCFSE